MNAPALVDRYYLEMRWRCLSLAADLDRIQRAEGGRQALAEPRIAQLRQAIKLLLCDEPNRAEQLQLLLSDKTPPPPR